MLLLSYLGLALHSPILQAFYLLLHVNTFSIFFFSSFLLCPSSLSFFPVCFSLIYSPFFLSSFNTLFHFHSLTLQFIKGSNFPFLSLAFLTFLVSFLSFTLLFSFPSLHFSLFLLPFNLGHLSFHFPFFLFLQFLSFPFIILLFSPVLFIPFYFLPFSSFPFYPFTILPTPSLFFPCTINTWHLALPLRVSYLVIGTNVWHSPCHPPKG